MARDSDTKAAVMAALLTGQGVNEIAAQYKVPKQTVSRWKDELPAGQIGTKKDRIDGLLLGYLESNLETLRIQSEFFRDKAWLEKQGAGEAAVLHGVLTDKSVRLLEALNAGQQRQQEEPDEVPQ